LEVDCWERKEVNRESASDEGALRFFALPFNDLTGDDMLVGSSIRAVKVEERKEGRMRESSPRLISNHSLALIRVHQQQLRVHPVASTRIKSAACESQSCSLDSHQF